MTRTTKAPEALVPGDRVILWRDDPGSLVTGFPRGLTIGLGTIEVEVDTEDGLMFWLAGERLTVETDSNDKNEEG